MPSQLNAYLLSAVLLAALLPSAPGAPVENITTESVEDDFSGDEMGPSDLLGTPEAPPGNTTTNATGVGLGPTDLLVTYWCGILHPAEEHHKALNEADFTHIGVNYNYEFPSFPTACPNSNFNEACLHLLVEGLNTYAVLFKHVEKEYSNNAVLMAVKNYSPHLISLIKRKMRDPENVTMLTSSQEEQLLKDIDNTDTYHRRKTANSILMHFRNFIVDGIRPILQIEKKRCPQ
uniref:interleukin-6-like isoform X2 n=1 Tax=Monopterus albus TaxID=43700 RepID=UPI0009B4BEC1|nr:interleukin-6-like isoform X2 [Monopterus albus]